MLTQIRKVSKADDHVPESALWDNLEETVCADIQDDVPDSDICATVAAAQGRKVVVRITREDTDAFFATRTPRSGGD